MKHIERLVEILNQHSDIDVYQINWNNIERNELYYVLDRLETSRIVTYESASVTVYVDFEENNIKYRGSSAFDLDCNLTDEEINIRIKEAIYRAKFVKNKFFGLPKNNNDFSYVENSNIKNEDGKAIAFKIADAIFKANVYQEGWINSTEVFVSKNNWHFINSLGCDYEYSTYNMMIEVIPTWSGKKEEVELYYSQYANNVDYNYITSEVDAILLQAKYRSEAETLPDDLKECDVILQKEEVSEFLSFFVSNMNYSVQYRKMSRYNVGDILQDEKAVERFNMTMVPAIKGSNRSRPIDDYGTVLKPIKVIENGKIINTYGDCKIGYYMNIEKPTGRLGNVDVGLGSKSFKEMKEKPYLLALNFSAFQLDDYSGYYGGEVRLGLYFDGKNLKPVTGFSIAGNIYEDVDKVSLSNDDITLPGYHGPKYLQVKMSISK